MIIAMTFQNKTVIFLDSILFLRLFPESVFLKSSVANLYYFSAIVLIKGAQKSSRLLESRELIQSPPPRREGKQPNGMVCVTLAGKPCLALSYA